MFGSFPKYTLSKYCPLVLMNPLFMYSNFLCSGPSAMASYRSPNGRPSVASTDSQRSPQKTDVFYNPKCRRKTSLQASISSFTHITETPIFPGDRWESVEATDGRPLGDRQVPMADLWNSLHLCVPEKKTIIAIKIYRIRQCQDCPLDFTELKSVKRSENAS